MLDTYLGIYCQGKTQSSIVSLKLLRMIGTQEQKYQHYNSLGMPLRSTIPCYKQKNGLRKTPRMIKSFNNNMSI